MEARIPMPRPHGRKHDELRPLSFKRRYTRQAPGSVLVRSGRTTVLCTCCVEQAVPPFLVGKGQGWLSAEYGMLPGSVLVRSGRTTVLCTCCVEQAVPPFLVGKGQGWLSAEYGMLPGSTSSRKPRDKGGKVDGRTVEIQRLIGRSLRAIVDLGKLG